jgi:hypothetical protein
MMKNQRFLAFKRKGQQNNAGKQVIFTIKNRIQKAINFEEN